MRTVRAVVLGATIMGLGMLLGAGVYESIVNAPNFQTNIPQSLEHFRQFMSASNPGNFFRIFAPLTQILALLSLILYWKRPFGIRWYLLLVFLLIVGADVITYTIHYPRNAFLFTNPLIESPELLQKAAAEWAFWNWFRVLASFFAVVLALFAFSKQKPE